MFLAISIVKKTSIVDNAVLDCAWKSLVKIDLYAQLKGQITFKIKLGLELETFRIALLTRIPESGSSQSFRDKAT